MANERKCIGDGPAKEDLLGFSIYVDALYNVIRTRPKDESFSIGLFGDWGTGKSTLMELLKKKLEAETVKSDANEESSDNSNNIESNDANQLENKYVTVMFKAWKYDGREEILNAMIQTILMEFKRLYPDKEPSIKEDIKRFSKIALSSIGSKVVSSATANFVDIDYIVNKYSEASEKNVEFLNKFECSFKECIDKYLGDKTLVIFIDDLDRCLPENAVKILESVKLFLDANNCVYIFGIDDKIIQLAITHRYADKYGDIKLSGKDYLEKIIQLQMVVPRPSPECLKGYIKKHFDSLIDDDLKDIVVYGCDMNPRNIKRFCNLYNLLSNILENTELNGHCIDKQIMALTLLIQLRFPDFYKYLSINLDKYDELLRRLNEGDYYTPNDINDYKERTDKIFGSFLAEVSPIFLSPLKDKHRFIFDSYKPDGDFKKDYLAYYFNVANLTGIVQT